MIKYCPICKECFITTICPFCNSHEGVSALEHPDVKGSKHV